MIIFTQFEFLKMDEFVKTNVPESFDLFNFFILFPLHILVYEFKNFEFSPSNIIIQIEEKFSSDWLNTLKSKGLQLR